MPMARIKWKYSKVGLIIFILHRGIFLRKCKKFAVIVVPVVFMPSDIILHNRCSISLARPKKLKFTFIIRSLDKDA